MTLSQLSHEQKLALVALLELFTMADGTVSDGEAEQINQIAEELGDAEYRTLLDETETRFEDIEMLKESLLTIRERAARELIYGLLMEEVMNAPTTGHRPELLEWLKAEWAIEVKEG
ncbi:MAG: hypothetical protein HN341_09330 [Verrucomicrobia bacterium]|nr:hypothetical protein [Verrucomicrobiota bacterium]